MNAKQHLFLFAFLLALGLILPSTVRASVLYPFPQTASVTVGKTIPVSILLESEGANINAAQAAVTYPSELLEVVSVSRGSSALVLWAEEPTVDSGRGLVTFAGGIPNGSIVVNAPLVTILFRGKTAGTGTVDLEPDASAVLLNDGQGTATQLTTRSAQITVVQPDSETPVLLSPSHPFPERWSNLRDVTMTWLTHTDALYSVHLTRDPNALPDDIPDENRGEIFFPSLEDGVWYGMLKERMPNDDWSPVAVRRVMIDGTPPEPFVVERIRDDATGADLLSFAAVDATSGIDHYAVRLLHPKYSWFPFVLHGNWEITTNPVRLDGRGTISVAEVVAVDLAGNGRIEHLAISSLRPLYIRFYTILSLLVLVLAVLMRMVYRAFHKFTRR